ncbi:MAG TPA: ASKHA domain-containing protein [Candidatus Limnocylindrales bacterium]|nr:ASKHA domain-containing protein [Candidatus Limnocylindrales bacterium]
MTSEAGAQVIFTPSGRRGRFASGTTILDAARSLGVDLDSVCGGRGLCGRCQVVPAEGSFPKHGIESSDDHLSRLGADEQEYDRLRGLAEGRRLGCRAHVEGDVLVDVPPESQVHRQVVRKGVPVRDFVIDPVVRLYEVEVEPPELDRPTGAVRRLLEALGREWRELEQQLDQLYPDLFVTTRLQPALDEGAGRVTVAIHDGHAITGVWPGLHDRSLGIALDIGSTTIAGHLANLATGEVLASDGVMNPQIRFGEDLMSRVSYAMLHEGGAGEMTRVVREAVASLVRGLASRADVSVEDILELTIVGNPIMHHLLLGIDPTPLGSAPFALAVDSAVRIKAAEIDLPGHPGARVYLLPCIAGHVGADAAGAILAETPYLTDEVTLLVDVGTNAEIVLGSRDRLLAASSPTGPAFEGAQISSGQRAAPGAIERVRVDRETLEPRFRVIGSSRWSDEVGFEASTRRTGVTGICGSGIVEVLAQLYLAGVITADGSIDGSLAARTPRVVPDGRTFSYVLHDGGPGADLGDGEVGPASPRILVTQNDVRAIQLAKAALYAGARLLMDHLGVATVDRVKLAGAFGSQIDPLHALVLGLVPDAPLDHVGAAGNAAGTGALIALLSGEARREIERVVRTVEKIETAVEPRFQEHFVDAMAIPHATDPSPNLAAVVDLPPRVPSGAAGTANERSRSASRPPNRRRTMSGTMRGGR